MWIGADPEMYVGTWTPTDLLGVQAQKYILYMFLFSQKDFYINVAVPKF